MKAARRLNAALRRRSSTFRPQTMVYGVVPVTPSTDPQRSSVLINNIETRTAINDIIAPDEYQAFFGIHSGFVWVSCSSKHRER
jgi:hypothetical protein